MSRMYRQGDILFKKIEKLPKNLIPVRTDVIVRGETGHSHKLVNGQIYRTFGFGIMQLFIKVEKSGRVIHEEHTTLQLPKGFYMVIRQREYLPEAWGGAECV